MNPNFNKKAQNSLNHLPFLEGGDKSTITIIPRNIGNGSESCLINMGLLTIK